MPDIPLQSHMHMALTLGSGPENAPIYQWAASDRIETPVIYLGVKRTLTGKIRLHSLKVDGAPKQIVVYKYVIKVDAAQDATIQERMQALKDMQGQVVYVCDHYHAPTGTDHTSTTHQMALTHIGDFKQFSPQLIKYYVEVQLEGLG